VDNLLRRVRPIRLDQRPGKTEASCHFAEVLKIDRLDDVVGRAQPAALGDVAIATRAGKNNYRNMPGSLISLDLAQNFDAIFLRQIQIEQNEFRQRIAFALGMTAVGKKKFEGLHSISDDVDRISQTRSGKSAQGEPDVVGIILHEQNLHHLGSPVGRVFEEDRQRKLQRARQLLHTLERRVARSAFEIGDIGSMETGAGSEFFLGNPEGSSLSLNCVAQEDFQFNR
jgi:hypothetical protein